MTEPIEGRFPARGQKKTGGTPRAPTPRRSNGGGDDKIKLWPGAPLQTARKFIADKHTLLNKAVTLHCHQSDFYAWDGSVYRRVSDAAMRSTIYSWLDKTLALKIEKDGTISEHPFNPKTQSVNEAVDALRAQAHIEAELPSWIGRAAEDMPDLKECIITKNGVVRLPTDERYSPTAELFATTCMPVQYDPDAGDPVEWLAFLKSLWPTDEAAISTLQQIFGYLLTPDTIQQKLFLVVGPPRSGKGTIARVLTAILGTDSVASPTLTSLEDVFGLQPLIGKTVGIISDARLSGKADQAQVAERLLSISGEDNVTIGRKHKVAWEGRMRMRFVLFSNELPRLADASGAVASRFVILQLQNSFLGREDTELERRLMQELPAILNWAIEGWKRLADAKRFTMPKSSKEAIDSLGSLSSPILSFVHDTCLIKSVVEAKKGSPVSSAYPFTPYAVGSMELFVLWKEWCGERGRHHGSDETFGRDLKAALTTFGVIKKRSRKDLRVRDEDWKDGMASAGKRDLYWIGIKLRTKATDEEVNFGDDGSD